MQGGTIKSIIIFVLLAIFAFIAGSFVTDGLSEALIPTVMIVGAFGLIALGKNSWWLLIILPPLFNALPVYLLHAYPIAYCCAGLVLIYWLYMSISGITHFTWHGIKWLDIATFALFFYIFYTWLKHPVSFKFMMSYTDEGEMSYGGDVYLWCIGALVFYIAVSVIPMKLQAVVKLIKWSLVLVFLFYCLVMLKQMIFSSEMSFSALESPEQQFGSTRERHPAFAGAGMMIFRFFIAKYALLGIILSPMKILVLMIGCAFFMISGHRHYLIQCFFYVLFVSIYCRQFILFVLLILTAWGGCVMLSHLNVLDNLPYTFQRCVSSVPGVEVGREAEIDAQGSLEWRYEMWEWAFDHRTGLINDYVWGDGFQRLSTDENRLKYLISMNKIKQTKIEFAETAHWHAGWLNYIHRIGIVGLIFAVIWFFVVFVVAFRVCKATQILNEREYVYMIVLAFPGSAIAGFWGDTTVHGLASGYMYSATIIKLVYALARDEGMMKPMFQRKRYVPLMVEANESQSKLRVVQ